MALSENYNPHLIYSPIEKIPLGEAVVLPNGMLAIRIKYKRGKTKVIEDVPLESIFALVLFNIDQNYYDY